MSIQRHPVLIDDRWLSVGDDRDAVRSWAPADGVVLPDVFPVSPYEELAAAAEAGLSAAATLAEVAPSAIANFLDAYAAAIEANADTICATAALETALPYEPRLRVTELARSTDQLRQAAAAARDRSWTTATIDTRLNIRSMYRPLGGPVVIFGPNNFPLAFNAVSGGDFAAAIAAGNPVIAKANPGHLSTTRLLAEAAHRAVLSAGLPPATVQLFYHCLPEDGLRLIAHPAVAAVAFTGSRKAGLALKAAADSAGKPAYLEMSSVNPVFLLPGALAERGAEIAAEFAASCLLGVGQFCTNPGLVIVPAGEPGEVFLNAATELFRERPSAPLLSPHSADQIDRAATTLRHAGAALVTGGHGEGFHYANTLLRCSGATFLSQAKALQTEAFGPVSLVVFVADLAEMAAVASRLEGSLTGTIYLEGQGDDEAYDMLEPILRSKVGRLLNNKMPTGVAVSPAMVHGGPYPATGHPGFTAVGIPASLRRFAALQAYDNVADHRLPPELQDKNPTGAMWRLVDGDWAQADIAS